MKTTLDDCAPVSNAVLRESSPSDLFNDVDTPPGVRVVQMTHDASLATHHIYPESRMCTPDGSRIILHRMAVDSDDEGAYWLCDLHDNFSLRQITEIGAIAPSITRDGRAMYYLAREWRDGRCAFALRRVSLETFQRETLMFLDGLPGVELPVRDVYPLSTISSDDQRLCTTAKLTRGADGRPDFALLVFDLPSRTLHIPLRGPDFANMHPQYSRSEDPAHSRDLLIQNNHGVAFDEHYNLTRFMDDLGADLHVMRDDGTHWRDLPFGRNGRWACTGHQQWSGTSDAVIAAVIDRQLGCERLFEAKPVAIQGESQHLGAATPGGSWIDLSRDMPARSLNHFGGDQSGNHFVLRQERKNPQDDLSFLLASRVNDRLVTSHLLRPRNRRENEPFIRGQSNKPRPFPSPDGSRIFFHSDVTGVSQAYMVMGFEFPGG